MLADVLSVVLVLTVPGFVNGWCDGTVVKGAVVINLELARLYRRDQVETMSGLGFIISFGSR